MIPLGPDPDNAGEGKSRFVFFEFTIPPLASPQSFYARGKLPEFKKAITMDVFVNDEQKQIKENYNLQKLLREINLHQKNGIAVAVNQKVIPKSGWQKYVLKDRDKIMVIQATQGG